VSVRVLNSLSGSLQQLDLTNNHAIDCAVMLPALTRFLARAHAMRSLSLVGVVLSGAQLEVLFDAMAQTFCWEDFHLGGVDVTDVTQIEMNSLLSIMQRSRRLARVGLYDFQLSDAQRQRILATVEAFCFELTEFDVLLTWTAEENDALAALLERNESLSWSTLRPALTDVCFGLAPLGLPTLLVVAVFDELHGAHDTNLFVKWTVASRICEDPRVFS
jgi:hypothetical protein